MVFYAESEFFYWGKFLNLQPRKAYAYYQNERLLTNKID